MSEKKNHKDLVQKCKDFFAKVGLPFTVSVDENKERIDKLVAFCKDKSCGTIEKFEDLMLVDGATKVTIEPTVEVGSAIALYAADGTPMPAPASDKPYELSDGRLIMVEQDGIIASITEKEVEMGEEGKDTPAPTEGAAPSVKEMIERIETVSRYNAELNTKFEAYVIATDKKIEDLTTENKTLTDKFSEAQKFQKESFELLLKEDAKTPVVPVNNPFAKKEKPKNIFEQFTIKK